MRKPFPWQSSTWQGLIARHRADRLPHALLIAGPAGLGKQVLADALAQAVLCVSPLDDGTACGQCTTCHLLSAGTHPDLLDLRPEEDGKTITVDKVRAVGAFLSLKSHAGRGKVVIVSPAQQMNTAAANSLLKNLEEPTAGTLLVLVTDRPTALLPTLRSRCQNVHLKSPDRSDADGWLRTALSEQGLHADTQLLLNLTNNAPLAALALAQGEGLTQREGVLRAFLGASALNVCELAEAWAGQGGQTAVQWMALAVMDAIRLKSGMAASDIKNTDFASPLQAVAARADTLALFGYLDRLTQAGRWLQGQVNVQLALEELLIVWNTMNRATAQQREVVT